MEHWDSVWKAQSDLFLWPTLRLWEFRKPTIAQVHGYALGGGTYWALLPDITVASDDAYFQMPLVQGLGFPGGETMIEPWVFMNWKRTYEYLYTAQTLTAAEALDMGLVNRVVPRDDLDATVDELAAHDRARSAVDAHGDQAAREARVGAHGHAHAPADVDRRDGRHRQDARRARAAHGDGPAWAPTAPAGRARRRLRPERAERASGLETYCWRPSSSLRSMPGGSFMRPLPCHALHHLLHGLELLEQRVDVGRA